MDTSWLGPPITAEAGVPRRVRVYSRLAAAIREREVAPGAMLPRESELGAAFGVSRTVVREALLLLEEDGFIVSRRGIGRFVSDEARPIGLGRLRPFEEVFASTGAMTGRRVELTTQMEGTDFVIQHLGVREDESTEFVETVFTRAGGAFALVQEHVVQGERLLAFGDDVRAVVCDSQHQDRTLFAALYAAFGAVFDDGVATAVAGVAGATRAELLSVSHREPVLVITRVIGLGGSPLLVSKAIVTARAGALELPFSGSL